MSENFETLRSLSDTELIKKHDRLAASTGVGIKYYLQELARRDQDKQTRAMLSYTKWITIMTLAISVLTIINVLIAIILTVKAGQ